MWRERERERERLQAITTNESSISIYRLRAMQGVSGYRGEELGRRAERQVRHCEDMRYEQSRAAGGVDGSSWTESEGQMKRAYNWHAALELIRIVIH